MLLSRCPSNQGGAAGPWTPGQLSTPDKQLYLQAGQAHDTPEPPPQASSVRIGVHSPERTRHRAPPARFCRGLEELPGVGDTERISGDFPTWSLTTDPHFPYLASKVPSNPKL